MKQRKRVSSSPWVHRFRNKRMRNYPECSNLDFTTVVKTTMINTAEHKMMQKTSRTNAGTRFAHAIQFLSPPAAYNEHTVGCTVT